MPFSVRYQNQIDSHRPVLFGFTFSEVLAEPFFINTDIKAIDDKRCEIWYSNTPVKDLSQEQSIFCRHNDDMAVIAIQKTYVTDEDIEKVTEESYLTLLKTAHNIGFPNTLRTWNYYGQITQGEGDLERYKLFCHGRARAFSQFNIDSTAFPAASALGHYSNRFTIILLCSKTSAITIDNAKQVSPYHYPRQYGQTSPSFARAGLVSWSAREDLFISGTAAIIGHESYHKNDIEAQTKLTLANINELLTHPKYGTYRIQTLKIYIRNPRDKARIETTLRQNFKTLPECIFLNADVCRQELDVEIEAYASQPK